MTISSSPERIGDEADKLNINAKSFSLAVIVGFEHINFWLAGRCLATTPPVLSLTYK